MKEMMRFVSAPSSPPARAVGEESFPKKQLLGGFIIGMVAVMVGFSFFVCFKKRCFGLFKHHKKRNVMLFHSNSGDPSSQKTGRKIPTIVLVDPSSFPARTHWNIPLQEDEILKSDQKIDLRRFRLEELEKATRNFSEECMVGSGAFGKVYKGALDADGTLAIKKAHADSYQSLQEFRNEVELLSRVKHKNLVSLVGFCDEAGQKLLVYEFVPNGSLLEYIMGRRGTPLTWIERVTIAIGAAKGICHLHEGVKPSIIHRDIKPSNILVGDEFEAKVSDFGLVKSGPVGDASHVSSQVKGTPGYLDPAYCFSLHLSPFSDVYSFGVILLQLVTARPAVDTSRNIAPLHISEWARPSLENGIIEDVLDANLLMDSCNKKMMLNMGQLGLRCVVKVPKERPTMAQVWQELEESFYSTQNTICKQPLRSSIEREESQSSMSMEGVRMQRFHVEMEGLSFNSVNMRCLENNSISIDADKHNLRTLREEDDSDYKSYMRN